MTTREALKLQLESALLEKEGLEAQNAKLREKQVDQAALVDAEAEVARCHADNVRLEAGLTQMKQLYEQLLRDMQAEAVSGREEYSEDEVADLRQQLDRQNACVQEWEEKYTHLEKEFECLRSSTELECHRACT